MKAIMLILALAVAQLAVAQRTVYFPGFELINMESSKGLQYSTSKLIKSYIEDNHRKYTILLDEEVGKGFVEQESLTSSFEKAADLNARYVMRGEIHLLQGLYVLSLGVYDTRSQDQVWHDMAKGSQEEDLDPLLSRLGRTFFTATSARRNIKIDEVTAYDQEGVELAQLKVNHFVGGMLGGKYVLDEKVLSGFGLVYTYDASTMLFNLNFEWYPTTTISPTFTLPERKLQSGNVALGIIVPLSRKRMTLYLDGGLEYGYYRLKEEINERSFARTESGLGAYVGGGMLLNRNSTVNLRLFGALSVPFYEVTDQWFPGVKFGIITSFSNRR